jgi:hypothetical protein
MNKSAHWALLCQTQPTYRQLWDEGRGPGQRQPQPGTAPVVSLKPPGGPGTELKRILSWFGINDQGGCACKDRARRMDAWGCDLCEERLDIILKWLRQEAKRRSLPFNEWGARQLVKVAIGRSRAKASAEYETH